MPHKLIPGSVWELSAPAHCIPAGRYQFQGEEDEFLVFRVGSKIAFGLSKYFYQPFLKPVETLESRKTSTDTFLEQYAKLFHQQASIVPGGSGMTFCAMHPSLQRKFWRLHRQSRKESRVATGRSFSTGVMVKTLPIEMRDSSLAT